MHLSEVVFLQHAPLSWDNVWPNLVDGAVAVAAHFTGESCEKQADAYFAGKRHGGWGTAVCRLSNGAYWLLNPTALGVSLREAILWDCQRSIDDCSQHMVGAIEMREALQSAVPTVVTEWSKAELAALDRLLGR